MGITYRAYTGLIFIGLSELSEGHMRVSGNGGERFISRHGNRKKIYNTKVF